MQSRFVKFLLVLTLLGPLAGMTMPVWLRIAAKNPSVATPVPLITGQFLGTLRNNYAGSVGMEFECTNNCHVVALGMYVVPGSVQNTCLNLFSITSSSTIAQVNPFNPTGLSGYNYISVTPAAMIAGQHYILMRQTQVGGDSWYDDNTTIVINTSIGVMGSSCGAVSGSGSCGSGTTLQVNGNVSYGPANLLVTFP